MRALLDTHVLLWWMADDPRLSPLARQVLGDRGNTLVWSAASTWELAIKIAAGKIKLPERVDGYVRRRLAQQGILELPVTHAHAAGVETLPLHHRDPFDRLLIAQAREEALDLITGDPLLAAYPVTILW